MPDTAGQPYAKLSELHVGDWIEIDSGFDCCLPGFQRVYQAKGGLAFACREGDHLLDDQVDDDSDECIGIYHLRAKRRQP